MTLDPAKPGGWDFEEVLTSDDLNALQAELLKAIDGTGGGTYTPLSDLVFGTGSLVRFAGVLIDPLGTLTIHPSAELVAQGNVDWSGDGEISGTVALSGALRAGDSVSGALIRVHTGSFLTCATGSITTLGGSTSIPVGAPMSIASSLVDLSGVLNVLSGGRVDVEDGGVVSVLGGATGGRITLSSGAKIVMSAGAEITVAATDDLVINAASFDFRVHLTPCAITVVSGVPDFAPQYFAKPVWVQHGVVGPPQMSFAIPIMPGDTITTVRLTLNGKVGVSSPGHSAPPGPPRFSVYKINTNGGETLLCEKTDPVTTLPAYDTIHTITLNSSEPGSLLPYTVQPSELIYATIDGETGLDAEPDTTGYLSIDGTGLARHYRNTSEVH